MYRDMIFPLVDLGIFFQESGDLAAKHIRLETQQNSTLYFC